MKYLRRGSGYYIDVGASQLVIDGKIKLKRGQVEAKSPRSGVKLDDGTELPADLIVYATGYGSMNGWAADLISQDVADKVGKVWGLGSDTPKDPGPWEGEQRNMWKPTQQEALWFHGGNLHQSRHYSQFLALQLKARMEGIPTPVYGLQLDASPQLTLGKPMLIWVDQIHGAHRSFERIARNRISPPGPPRIAISSCMSKGSASGLSIRSAQR